MPKTRDVSELNSQLQRTPIAITGLAALFAQANNLQEYWENILHKVDSITDVPPSRWKLEDYYDPDPRKPDKTYSKRGGFIPDIDFDPMEFGLPPNILEVTDILQLLSLHVARQVLNDAGYGEGKTHDHSRTGVILGIGGTAMTLFTPLAARLEYPVWEKVMRAYGIPDADIQKIVANLKLAYVPWEENSFPGVIANVVAGRIANRFDFGGTNCTVDAACGSSIAAAKFAVTELVEHRADLMLTGGADANNTPIAYTSFSKTPAFTLGSNLRVFDASSDGMLVGEGLGMLALKRLEDAERDGDRIYAVIRGVGSSSDGKYKSIYAPSAAGQAAAVRRAYEDAGFPPSTVTLIEAHGTGTPVGDPVEVEALTSVIGENNPEKQVTGLGSVKGNIGHTKAAAGSAGMVKTALALYHKILPPTINVTQPNPKLGL
jgi:polyketide-type polyunsaturated fatty acid synthase PfaA